MSDLPTFDDLYATGQAEVVTRDPRLTDWSEGSALDGLVGGGAAMADDVIGVLLAEFRKQFVDTATGADLDALATDRFGLTRRAASEAIGEVTIGRGSEVGAFTVDAGLQVSGTVDGETVAFTTDVDAIFGGGDSSVTVAATCTTTGRAGNVDAAVIDTVDSPPIASPTITVTNAERFAGGSDAESDEAFRGRIRAWFRTLRKGTIGALEAGAKSVAGVVFAAVDESTIAPDDGGYVSMYIGDPEGAANGALVALVEAELETGGDDGTGWRAAGIEVRVFAAVREEISLALTVTIRRGANRTDLEEAIRAAVLDYVDALDPGATLYLPQVESRAIRTSSDVRTAQVTTPTADRAPTNDYNALRVLPSALTLTFVEV